MKRCFGFAWHVMRLVIFFLWSLLRFVFLLFYSSFFDTKGQIFLNRLSILKYQTYHTCLRAFTVMLNNCCHPRFAMNWRIPIQTKYLELITLIFISFKLTGFKVLSNSVHMASWKIDTCVCKMQIFAILYETNSK